MTTLAFIGCAHIHTPGFIKAIKKRDDVKVKSVWDHDAKRGQKRADELGAKFVEEAESIFADRDVQAVVICSETDRHEQLVAPAAEAKKDLFVEKPLGMGAKDAKAMSDAIAAAGVKFQTGYFMRGQPALRFIKERIDKGHFGKLTHARGSNCHAGALKGFFDDEWRWMAEPKHSGVGAYGDLGTHALDILMWWFGGVTSCISARANGTARYPDCDEVGEGILRFDNGVIASLAASWDDIVNPVSFQVCGTEGAAAVINGALHFQSTHEPGSDIKTPWPNLPEAKNAGFEAFLDAVTGKPADLVPVADAASRSAVMEALYQSRGA